MNWKHYTLFAIVFVAVFFWYQNRNTGTNTVATKVKKEWENDARSAADYYGVPLDIILAVICVESAGDVNPPYGAAGEVGLMQMTPAGFADVVKNGYAGNVTMNTLRYEALQGWGRSNIFAGTALLKIYRVRGGSWDSAIQMYNPGKKDQVARVNYFRSFF